MNVAVLTRIFGVAQDFCDVIIIGMKHQSNATVRAARDVLKEGARLFTLSEVSEILCVSYEMTRELFLNGDIPGFSLNSKHAVVMEIELNRYMQAQSDAQTRRRKLLAITPVSLQPEVHESQRSKRPLPNLALYEHQLPTARKSASAGGTSPIRIR